MSVSDNADINLTESTTGSTARGRSPLGVVAASVGAIAAFWLMSSYGYYYLVAYLGLENGYNDAPFLFAEYYLLWTILALIWFRPIFSGAMRRISLRDDAVAVLPLVVVFGGFIVLVLPALPEIAVWRAPADPPEFMFASAWYYLPKSFDILFQQVLIAALIRTAAGQGFSLVATSIGMAALFGGFHLMLAFDGFMPTYVIRFTIAATLFGLLAPYLYLRMRRGFLWAYGLHWSFYALDATTTHFVLAAPVT